MSFTREQSRRLDIIRSIAVILILVTHVSQEYKLSLGQYTNIGVQIFLSISGFIYSQKEKIKWTDWYKKRILRIVPPYYLLLLITFFLYFTILHKNIFSAQYLTHFTALHFLFYPNYPYWGGHLWYLTAIVICYAMLPVLFQLYKRFNVANILIFFFIMPILLFFVFYITPFPYRLSGDIYTFIIAFLVGKYFGNKTPIKVLILVMFLSGIIFLIGEVAKLNNYWNSQDVKEIIDMLWPWKKCIYGISTFLVLYNFGKVAIIDNKLINFISNYSYEIYLSHKNFILGPLSVLYLTNFKTMNIFISLLLTMLCSLAIKSISNKFVYLVQKAQ